jgi:hypothetical protein
MWKLLFCRSHHRHNNNKNPRPTTRFSVLARDRRFEELADLLAPSRLQKYGGGDDEGGLMDVPLPLHYLLRYQPPLSIVNRLLQFHGDHDKTKPEHVDSFGRNALHIACYYNADVSILARLVNYEPAILNVPDIVTGRYPLHFLCDRYDSSLATSALFLRDVLPMASSHHDVDGHTPADILQHQQNLHHSPTRDFSLLPSPPPPPPASASANNNSPAKSAAAKEKTTAQKKNMKKKKQVTTKDSVATASVAAAPSTLHIPYDLVTTVSDLTDATAFLLMNLIDPPPPLPLHHHNNNINNHKAANVSSLHSKSTCSTTTTTDSAGQQQHHEKQRDQQMMIVNAVRKQLSKHPIVLHQHQMTTKRSTKRSTTKRSTKSTIDEESSAEDDEEAEEDVPDDEYDREDATAPLLPHQKYHHPTTMTLPPRRCVTTAAAAAEDWESVRC